jgi:uncharacterized repeat protein (TIGR01451 family)
MKKTAIGLAFLLAFTVSNTTLVQAKETGPLQINMKSYAISSNAEGKEVATETTEVDPKQVLEFRAIYKNTGSAALNDLVVTGPIPSATQYQANTAIAPVDAAFEVSVDGGKTYESEPVTRTVKGKKVIIPASQYTHVRWIPNVSLAANSEQVYSYRVQVK